MTTLPGTLAQPPALSGARAAEWTRPDARRSLQLALAVIWLLDGVLQLQGYFFTRQFGASMLPSTAPGNPGVIRSPITWAAGIVAHHPVWTNATFASVQITIGLAIAWRRSSRAGLAASVLWSLGVWWFGEGLGGVLNGTANPVDGAPGAVVIYALLAVLLWPADGDEDSLFVASEPVGARSARILWLLLWGSLAYLAVAGTNRAPGTLSALISGEADGEPRWLASMDTGIATAIGHHGLALTVVLAVLLGVVAAGIYLPRPAANAAVLLALVLAATIWVIGEDFGALFTNGATDVNSGPLLALLALAYWPRLRTGTGGAGR